jgi:parallel beta-helix repeat protein
MKGNSGKKLIAAFLSFILISAMLYIMDLSFGIIDIAGGEVLYVNKTGSNGAYMKIQDAIDNASSGDMVFVYNGTYYENLVVNKTINLIGEDRVTTIIDGRSISDVVKITANMVNITGFTLQYGGWGNDNAGIKLHHVNNCTIFDNKLLLNRVNGLYLSYSNNNNIYNNNISNRFGGEDDYGIYLHYSNYNNIKNNTFYEGDYGIFFYFSEENEAINNEIRSNAVYGLHLHRSSHNKLHDNVASSYFGIYLFISNNIDIRRNYLTSAKYAILIDTSNNIEIIENNVSNSDFGIYSQYSIGGSLENNTLFSNKEVDICIALCRWYNISGNIMTDRGIRLLGSTCETWNTHNIDLSNIVKGRPVYFWKNIKGGKIPLEAGQIILGNCTNISVIENEITGTSAALQTGFCSNNSYISNIFTNNTLGISIVYCNGILIKGNTVIGGGIGIYLADSIRNIIFLNNASFGERGILNVESDDNNIEFNIVINNTIEGIGVYRSYENRIFHNNIINNGIQAYDDRNTNLWDSGYPGGGNYWSNYTGDDCYKGPNQDIPGCDGIGDINYSIDSDSIDNYPLLEPFENYLFLKQGWNLISIPQIQDNQNLQKVLEMIEGYYDAVQWYDPSDPGDPWDHHKVGKPFGNNLFVLNETMGFWIHITNPGDTIFLYNGTQPSENQTIPLKEGWNLLGYPSLTNHNRTVGLNHLEFGVDVDSIQWFNSTTQTWHFMEPEENFIVGKGYWIHAKADCVWEVPL